MSYKALLNKIPLPYRDEAYQYCRKVILKEILVNKKVYKTVTRHLNDLLRMEDDSFDFIYIPDRAEPTVRFMEILSDPKKDESEKIKLAYFQQFIVRSLFGWVRKDNHTHRRFKKAFISIAKKNGKSLLSASIQLFTLLFDVEAQARNRECYSIAQSREQAAISYGMAEDNLKILRADFPDIHNTTKITNYEGIKNLTDGSVLKTLSRDKNSMNGKFIHCAIVDEYADSSDSRILQIVTTSMAGVSPLLFIISTAGLNLSAPMHTEEIPYAEAILSGEIEDDSYFCFLAGIDNREEVYQEDAWIKANPLMELPAEAERIKRVIRDAVKKAEQTRNWGETLTWHFNMWVQADSESYMTADEWEPNEDDSIDITGREVYIGLDLSRSDDLTAVSFVFPLEKKNNYYVTSHSFLGTVQSVEAKEQMDKIPYKQLIELGYVTPSNLQSGIVNYEQVLDYIDEYVKANRLKVKCLAYDPYNINQFLALLENKRSKYPLVEVGQNYRSLNDPIKEFRLGNINKTIKHEKNLMLTRSIYNSIIKKINDAVMLDKTKNRNKIDPTVSVICAYSEAIHHKWRRKRKRPAFLDVDVS